MIATTRHQILDWQNKVRRKLRRLRLLWTLLSLSAAIFASYWLLVTRYVDGNSRGPFGDMFGGVNALFTGMAFAGLIYTAVLQRRELALQRKELQQTRQQLAGQREELAAQNATFQMQSFENTFFQLLTLHHEIIKAIRIERGRGSLRGVHEGRQAFEFFFRLLRDAYQRQPIDPRSPEEELALNQLYMGVYTHDQTELGHYFRNLYHIVKLIDGAALTVAQKRQYAAFARAQLSTHELLCLFYNCLSQMGVEKFKPLVERYTLLKNMPTKLLIRPEHQSLYDPGAFIRDSR